MTNLTPVPGKFSLAKFLEYMDENFFGTHKSTAIEADFNICYNANHEVIAFYDNVNKELWAVQ